VNTESSSSNDGEHQHAYSVAWTADLTRSLYAVRVVHLMSMRMTRAGLWASSPPLYGYLIQASSQPSRKREGGRGYKYANGILLPLLYGDVQRWKGRIASDQGCRPAGSALQVHPPEPSVRSRIETSPHSPPCRHPSMPSRRLRLRDEGRTLLVQMYAGFSSCFASAWRGTTPGQAPGHPVLMLPPPPRKLWTALW